MSEQSQPNNPTFSVPPERMDIAPVDSHKSFFMRHLLAEILGIVLAGAVLAGGYFYYASTTEPIPETKVPVHVEKDPTVDWQTYTNAEYGFEFKYPKDWLAPKESTEEVYLVGEFGTIFDCEGVDCMEYGFFATKAPLSDFGPHALETPEQLLNWINNTSTSADLYTLISDVTKDDQRLIKWSSEGGIGIKYYRLDIFRPAINRIVHIQFWTRGDAKIFDQILSTFKFTEPTVQVNSYASCVAAGNPISKSKPPKCTTADGITFVEPVGVCIQVIVTARNQQTGEVRDFPTPCDVPEGWIDINIPANN